MAFTLTPTDLSRDLYKGFGVPNAYLFVRSALQVQMRTDLTATFFNTTEFGGLCRYQHYNANLQGYNDVTTPDEPGIDDNIDGDILMDSVTGVGRRRSYAFIEDMIPLEDNFGGDVAALSTEKRISIPTHTMAWMPTTRDKVEIQGILYNVVSYTTMYGISEMVLEAAKGARI